MCVPGWRLAMLLLLLPAAARATPRPGSLGAWGKTEQPAFYGPPRNASSHSPSSFEVDVIGVHPRRELRRGCGSAVRWG